MKNIQVIDGAANSVFEIYEVEDEIFYLAFPEGREIAFAADVRVRSRFWKRIYPKQVQKALVQGIHGTLHLRLSQAEPKHFPNRMEADCRLPHRPDSTS